LSEKNSSGADVLLAVGSKMLFETKSSDSSTKAFIIITCEASQGETVPVTPTTPATGSAGTDSPDESSDINSAIGSVTQTQAGPAADSSVASPSQR